MGFGDFFTYLKHLIAGDNEAIIKMKKLKNIYKNFRPSKYRFVTKERVVTNLFLQKVYNVYKILNLFKPIFESTIFSPDEKRADIYLNYYIESFLPEELRTKRDKFLRDSMLAKINQATNPGKVMKSLEGEFRLYKGQFTRVNMPQIESEYLLLYRLNSLSTFNFELFFSKFDMEFDRNLGTPPTYNPVNGNELVSDIKDLYFLIGTLPKKVDLTGSFKKLLSRNPEVEVDKKQVKLLQQELNNLFKIILNELTPPLLLNMARYVNSDPALKIGVELRSFSILEKYRKDIEERFMKNREFVLEKYSAQSLQSDIKALFKNVKLLPIDGYSDEIMDQLSNKGADALTGIQGLRITKTFIFELYEKRMKEYINMLILEGFFNEKEYQKEFSDIFFKANELLNFYVENEKSIVSSGSNSLNSLNKLISSDNVNKMKITVGIINEKIVNCNKRCAEVYYKLGVKLYEILSDYKQAKPQKVSNIKQIKSGQNKEFITKLAGSYSELSKYIKLIKNFVVFDTGK